MKILIIQPWLSYRGAESISIDEAWGLRKLGHSVSILCLYVDKKRLRQEDLALDFILPPPFLARFCQRSNMFFFIFGFFILLLLFLLKGRKFDIYNPHNFPSPWVAVVVSRFYKKPVYWTVHNFPQHGFTNPFVSRIWEWIIFRVDQSLVARLNAIICVSEKVKKQVYNTYRRQSTVVYPPVDITFFINAKRNIPKSLNIPPKSSIVLIPSKLHQIKNVIFALDAISTYLKTNNNTTFIFAGEGSLMKRLQADAELIGITPYVRFAGFVPKEQLRDLYKAAEFIFLPGRYGEGFNIVVLEALCTGTPSVVLEGSGVDQWVKNNGIGFVVRVNKKEIANLFHELLTHKPKLLQAGKKGKQIIADYSPQKYAQKLLMIYNVNKTTL
jgi:glycosyltransferase involved in cell wall biosynthesis